MLSSRTTAPLNPPSGDAESASSFTWSAPPHWVCTMRGIGQAGAGRGLANVTLTCMALPFSTFVARYARDTVSTFADAVGMGPALPGSSVFRHAASTKRKLTGREGDRGRRTVLK